MSEQIKIFKRIKEEQTFDGFEAEINETLLEPQYKGFKFKHAYVSYEINKHGNERQIDVFVFEKNADYVEVPRIQSQWVKPS